MYCDEELNEEEWANDDTNINQYLGDVEIGIDILDNDLPLMMESDIPSASLNGKDPAELHVVQLR